MTVQHASFTIERDFPATPARVFAAFAKPEFKRQWFTGPDEWVAVPHELDFREGGTERVGGGPQGGPVHTYQARYHDIVAGERIVTTYEMYAGDTRTSVSVASFEFQAHGDGTRLVITESGAFLDGLDDVAERERGTRTLLDHLEQSLQASVAR